MLVGILELGREKFDVVILDPSKLTRDRDEIETALRKYTDMNRLAMQVVCDGGILLTCSCTGLVSEFDFFDSVRKAGFLNHSIERLKLCLQSNNNIYR